MQYGIMPARYHEHDAKWISETLARLHPSQRTRACCGYNAVYDESFKNEPTTHRKSNKARHDANSRIRLYVDNVLAKESEVAVRKMDDVAINNGGSSEFEW